MARKGGVIAVAIAATGLVWSAVPAPVQAGMKGIKDLRAIHALIHHLGPAGGAAPSYLPSDREPALPYARFYLSQP
jgi:hypothetical protein